MKVTNKEQKKAPSGISFDLGARIRKLRNQRALSLRDLAKKSGCSTGFLSLLETNQMSPTLAGLTKVCSALKVPLSDLLREEPQLAEPAIVSLSEGQKAMFWRGIEVRHLFPLETPMSLTALQLIIEPGGETPVRAAKRSMKQLAIVFSGSVQLSLGSRLFQLKPETAIYFDLREQHQWTNNSDRPVRILTMDPYQYSLFEQEEEDFVWAIRNKRMSKSKRATPTKAH
jgi:transcriptional regulator with XRE-family HTH domain